MSEEREMTLEEWVNRLPENHSARKEYKGLVRDQRMLSALEAGGVDNWEWYSESLQDFWAEEDN